jgi:hypothetical protein
MPVIAVVFCFALYFVGCVSYSKYLAEKVYALRRDAATPAHVLVVADRGSGAGSQALSSRGRGALAGGHD